MNDLNTHSSQSFIASSTIVLLRMVLSCIVATTLFLILPFAHGLFESPEKSIEEKVKTAQVIIQRQKVEEKRETEKIVRHSRELKQSHSTRQLNATMKFIPDLGIGNTNGVGVTNSGMKTSVFEMGEVDTPPKPLSRMNIPYPHRAKAQGIEGTVSVIIRIGRDGRVNDVEIESSPSKLFNSPVVQQIKKWKFIPGQVGGVAVEVRMRQKITFELHENND